MLRFALSSSSSAKAVTQQLCCRNAILAQLVDFGPNGHGWKVHGTCGNNHLEVVWFEGLQTPTNMGIETVEDMTMMIRPCTIYHQMKRMKVMSYRHKSYIMVNTILCIDN